MSTRGGLESLRPRGCGGLSMEGAKPASAGKGASQGGGGSALRFEPSVWVLES
jgi:hypothetical protein